MKCKSKLGAASKRLGLGSDVGPDRFVQTAAQTNLDESKQVVRFALRCRAGEENEMITSEKRL